MTSLALRIGDLFVLQIVQVTLLILAVGLTTRLFCRRRAYPALVLWTVVLVKCVVPPIVCSPCGAFCWMDHRSAEPSQSGRAVEVGVVPSSAAGSAALPAVATQTGPGTAGALPAADSPVGNAISRATIAHGASFAVAVWLVGALVLLVAYAVRYYLFLHRMRHATVGGNEVVGCMVARLSRHVHLHQVPRVMMSDDTVGPAVFGLLRPTIILPWTLVHNCSRRQLTPIVLHELIHIRRGDLWLALLSVLVRSLWWFHPLVWWALRQVEWESERCCDESVVATLRRDTARYAHSLITALEHTQRGSTFSLVAGVRSAEITANRLERIMKLRQGSHRRMPVSCWILAALAAAFALPGSGGSFAQLPGADRPAQQVPAAWPPSGPDAAGTAPQHDLRVEPASPDNSAGEPPSRVDTDASDVTFTKAYVVTDLLGKLQREAGWPAGTPRERLQAALVSHLWPPSSQLPAGTLPGAPAEPEVATAQGVAQPSFGWHDDLLVVSGTRASHQRLADQIGLWHRRSFREICVEVRIIQGDPGLCVCSDRDSTSDQDAGASGWRDRWILFQQAFANEESEPMALEPSAADAPGARAGVPDLPTAKATSDKSCPVVYQFVDDRELRSFQDAVESDQGGSVILAPRVRLLDGTVRE